MSLLRGSQRDSNKPSSHSYLRGSGWAPRLSESQTHIPVVPAPHHPLQWMWVIHLWCPQGPSQQLHSQGTRGDQVKNPEKSSYLTHTQQLHSPHFGSSHPLALVAGGPAHPSSSTPHILLPFAQGDHPDSGGARGLWWSSLASCTHLRPVNTCRAR